MILHQQRGNCPYFTLQLPVIFSYRWIFVGGRPKYVAAHNTAISRQPWPPSMLYPIPYEHLPTDLRPRYYTHRETIAYTAYDNCWILFTGAGVSFRMSNFAYLCTKISHIPLTVAAAYLSIWTPFDTPPAMKLHSLAYNHPSFKSV